MDDLLKDGASCAASVYYAGDKTKRQWIVGKIEKRQANGKYYIRDEDADSRKYLHYTAGPERILPYPPRNNKYYVNEDILALWMIEPDVWTTIFYPAKVTEIINDHEIKISYEGSDENFNIDISKCTKLHDTDEEIEKKEEEENPEQVANSLTNLDPNFQNNSNNKNNFKSSINIGNESNSSINDQNINNLQAEDQLSYSKGNDVDINDDQSNDVDSNDNSQISNKNQEAPKNTQKRYGRWGKAKMDRSAEPEIEPEYFKKEETRKAKFVFNVPVIPENPPLPTLEDEEFTKSVGLSDISHIDRSPIQYNYDLLKYLDNPTLYPKVNYHLAGTGRIHVEVNNTTTNSNTNENDNQPVIKSLDQPVKISCGRLGKMFSYWNQSSK